MATDKYQYYKYTPSLPAAIIFLVCFLITTSLHVVQAFRKRTYYFIPLIVGGFFEWVGYLFRALGHNNMENRTLYILQTVLLLLAPALFAASIYMVLGRLILFTEAEKLAPIRVSRLTKIFVTGDVFSFLVQAGGGGLMTSANRANLGKTLVIIGLVLQLIFFGIFILTSFVFHRRIERDPTSVSLQVNWQRYIYALYSVSGLIFVRSVFRVIEFSGGRDGYIMRHEVFLYIFDSVLMLTAMVIFNVVHPGEIIGRGGRKHGDDIVLEGGRRPQMK
ncbi:hypothetical protein B7494_g5365 [Chlorociboria aeruginascens]|nr:hypothetical protein B7494_g5365 [Chlorociboria aeruginascens]